MHLGEELHLLCHDQTILELVDGMNIFKPLSLDSKYLSRPY